MARNDDIGGDNPQYVDVLNTCGFFAQHAGVPANSVKVSQYSHSPNTIPSDSASQDFSRVAVQFKDKSGKTRSILPVRGENQALIP